MDLECSRRDSNPGGGGESPECLTELHYGSIFALHSRKGMAQVVGIEPTTARLLYGVLPFNSRVLYRTELYLHDFPCFDRVSFTEQ